MATALEYFEKDQGTNLRVSATHTLNNALTGEVIEITAGLALDFDAGAKFGFLYIPDTPMFAFGVAHYLSNVDDLLKLDSGTLVGTSMTGTDDWTDNSHLIFTRRIVVYTPRQIPLWEKSELHKLAASKDMHLAFRDGAYVDARDKVQIPVAFISHDFRDKDELVRELASELSKRLLSVWYDEYSLIAGRSLRESIERGLRSCKKCILVLSPNFLSNTGWTKAEFDSVFTREILEKKNVVIPIWHNVTKQDVYDYSMRLADKIAIPSTLPMDEIVRKITLAIDADEQAP